MTPEPFNARKLRLFPLPYRLAARLEVDPETGCHNWIGAATRGYGRIRAGGRAFLARRVAYEQARGPIPSGLVIDHLCRNPRCCNPDHLEAVTTGENTRRGISGARYAARTHCPKGHPYDEVNTHRTRKGYRKCRRCWTEADKLKRVNSTARNQHLSAEVNAQILALFSSTLNDGQIARQVGVSASAVWKRRRKERREGTQEPSPSAAQSDDGRGGA